VLHGALAAVLHRAGAGDDIAMGTVVAGRTHADLDNLVGFFVNMLILRMDLSGDPTVGGLLARSKETSLAALTHQDVPFDQVVSTINPQRVPGRHPLVDVVLALQNNLSARLTLPGARTRVSILRPGVARFGILVEAVDEYSREGAPLGLTLTVEYQEGSFERPTADWLASCLADTLEAMAEQPAAPLTSVTRLLERPPRITSIAPSLPMATASAESLARPEAPREGLEERLAAIWADVLDTGRVGRHEDFFDLGGNSLRAVRVAARIAVAEGLPARAEQIFATPTVAGLAGSLARMTADQGPVIPRVPRVPRRTVPRHTASAQGEGK
jgi:nonribosomal peptide synthetase DhbF